MLTHLSKSHPWLSTLLLALVYFGCLQISEAQENPSSELAREQVAERINEKTKELLHLIRDNQALLEEDEEAYQKLISDQINTWVDVHRFARGIMGRFYKEATPEQIDIFINTARISLLKTYTGVLNELRLDSIRIDKRKTQKKKKRASKPGKATVLLSVQLKTGRTYPFRYSMSLNEEQQWLMYNLIVDGINFGLVYRNQFASAMADPINQGQINLVIEHWSRQVNQAAN